MNIDRVVIAGRITQAFDLREDEGNPVCTLPVATNKYCQMPDGTRQAKAVFFDISVFGKTAQKAHERLRVGNEVVIEGHHQNREIQADGKTYKTLCIVADHVHWNNYRKQEVPS